MDRTETKDDLDRCRLWDKIFEQGPLSVAHLYERTRIAARRIKFLLEHEWFLEQHGLYYIATESGQGKMSKRGFLLAR
jgi:hypothetical protein